VLKIPERPFQPINLGWGKRREALLLGVQDNSISAANSDRLPGRLADLSAQLPTASPQLIKKVLGELKGKGPESAWRDGDGEPHGTSLDSHMTVSELCQNPPFHEGNGMHLRAKQIPQVNENRNGGIELT
jgi:hypothetical protein